MMVTMMFDGVFRLYNRRVSSRLAQGVGGIGHKSYVVQNDRSVDAWEAIHPQPARLKSHIRYYACL